jgi:hypothetical protein
MGYEAETSTPIASRRSAAACYHVTMDGRDRDTVWDDGIGDEVNKEAPAQAFHRAACV